MRESALVREIAAAYQGPGRLVTYSDETGLIDCLCRLVHGRPVSEVPLANNRMGRAPSGWTAAGESTVAFVDSLIRTASPVQIRARAALGVLTGRSDQVMERHVPLGARVTRLMPSLLREAVKVWRRGQ